MSGTAEGAGRRWVRALGAGALVVGMLSTAGIIAATPAGATPLTTFPNETPTVFTTSGSCVDGTYTVPAGIHELVVETAGAAGGGAELETGEVAASGTGGAGSVVEATIRVSPGQVLYINVAPASPQPAGAQPDGQAGFPGTGTYGGPVSIGGSGGSASWVSGSTPITNTGNTTGACRPRTTNLLEVAAGGGGAGAGGGFDRGGNGGSETVNAGHGGDGGTNGENDGAGGGGATATAGGGGGAGGYSSGPYGCRDGTAGTAGSFLQGGQGGTAGSDPAIRSGCQGEDTSSGSGGGGGGGYYGGGGGGGADDNRAAGGGGGAGSSYVVSGATLDQPITSTTTAPFVSIRPGFNPPALPAESNAPTHVTTEVGGSVTFTAPATGYPVPSLNVTGQLPPGVYFSDNQDGTYTVSGTPAPLEGNTYTFTVVATNQNTSGTAFTATKRFTIVVDEAPQFQPIYATQFAVGKAGTSFGITTYGGYPVPSITETGAMPAGVTLTDHHNGTATISGTPLAGSGNYYPITITATSTTGFSATQPLVLQVDPIPVKVTVHSTANPSVPGQSVTFSASTTPPVTNDYVTFTVDGGTASVESLNTNGVATLPAIGSLGVGGHTITAALTTGQTTYASTTGTLTQTVRVLTGSASGTSLTASPVPPGTVYFRDGGTAVIHEKSASGTTTIVPYTAGDGLAVDATGDVYSQGTSFYSPSIVKRSPSGTVSTVTTRVSQGVQALATDPAGTLFIADTGFGEIDRVTPSGAFSTIVSGTPPYVYQGSGAQYDFGGIATDAAGDVFFTDDSTNSGRLLELAPPYTKGPTVLASGLNTPQGVAVDAGGDVFVADTNAHKVIEVAPSGVQTTVESGDDPSAVAVDAAGNLYVAMSTTPLVTVHPAPYTGGGTNYLTGHTVTALATSQPATPVTTLQPVPLTATVVSSPVGATPTGTVTFTSGGTTLGTGHLDGGAPDTATLTVAAGVLAAGTHVITATYGGNGSFPGSTSSSVTVTVGSPILTIPVTGTQVYGGSGVTFAPHPTVPTGVTVSGSLSGCTTTVSASATAGSYSGTISGCSGLTLTGPNAYWYSALQYAYGAFTVTGAPISVTITGTLPYTDATTFSYAQPTGLPSGVTGVHGTLTGCTTSESNTAPSGTYPTTISGCSGLSPTGPAAHNYQVRYVDGGVTVTKGQVKVTVTATQPYLGNPTFTNTLPTTYPSGVTSVTGTMSGCTTSVTSTAGAGGYSSTISACGGLSLTGPNSSLYAVDYVDGGVTVTPLPLAVTVTAVQPYSGLPSFRYSQPASLPTGVTAAVGTLTGCTTTVAKTATPGTYPGTISGCGGLSFSGTNGPDYVPSYTYGALTVSPGPTGTSLSVSPVTAPTLFAVVQSTDRLVKYSAPYTGTPTTLATRLTYVSSVVADPAGDTFFIYDDEDASTPSNPSQTVNWSVNERTATGQRKILLTQRQTPGLSTGATGLALDRSGDLFIADSGHNRILELAPPYTGTPTVVASGLHDPTGVAVDSAGDLFIAEAGNGELVEVTPGTGSSPVVYVNGGTTHPVISVAVDAAGDLYYGEAPDTDVSSTTPIGRTGHVYELKPPYVAATAIEVSSTPVANNAYGVAVDHAGDVFVANSGIGGNGAEAFEVSGETTSVLKQSAAPAGVALDQPPTQVKQGAAVTFTATVISSPPGNYPTGTVDFTSGGTLLGTGTLTGTAPDTATVTTTALPPGAHTVTASFTGNLNYPASTSGTETVDVYSPVVTVGASGSRTYGGSSTTFTASVPAVHPGVTVSGSLTGCSSTVTSSSSAGNYGGTISGCGGYTLSGPTAGTYTLAYADDGVTVSPINLPVTVDAARTYGGTTTFTAVAPTLPTGITAVGGTLTGCTSSAPTAKAAGGPYAGTISGCGGLTPTGPLAADYTVTYVDGGLTVSKAPVAVTVTGHRTFGAAASFVAHPPSPLPTGISAVTGSLSGCATTTTTATSVGTYAAAISGCGGLSLSGSLASDYAVAYSYGTMVVAAATLTVTVYGTQPYGGSPSFSYTPPAGLPNGITGIVDTLAGCATAETAGAIVGSYLSAISGCNGLNLAGANAGNYSISYAIGAFTVTAVTLTVTPQSQLVGYGTAPSFDYAISGYRNGDTTSALTTAPTCGVAGAHASPGSYTITCSGGSAVDYTFNETATATLTVVPGTATQLGISTQPPTSLTAGNGFGLVVRVEDAGGNLVTSSTVRVTVALGTGTGSGVLAGVKAVNASGGVATFSGLTLDQAGSDDTLTITSATLAPATTRSFTVNPAAASALVVSAPTSTTAGSPFGFTVTAEDQFGNTATGYAGTVHLSSTDGRATLPSASTLTAGARTFSATLDTAGSQSITATDGSLTAKSGTIAVAPAAVSRFVVSAPTTATADTEFGFTVTAKDPYGNTVTGYAGTVAFSATGGDRTATVLPLPSTLTGGTGLFGAFLNAAGPQTITATDVATASITGTSEPVTISPAAATHFVISAPATATAGTPFTFTVTAEDQFGNTVPGYTGTVGFSSTDTGASTVLPTAAPLDGGTGTFTATLTTAGSDVITATDTTDPSVTGTLQSPVNVHALGATQLITSLPTTTSAGTSFLFTVSAEDRFGNYTSDYPGSVQVTSSDPGASTFYQVSSETFLAVLDGAGPNVISITDPTDPALDTSPTVAVQPGNVSQLAVSAPTTGTAGTAFTFTVTAEDQFGNTVPDYTGTVGFTASADQATLPAEYQFSAGDLGVHTFSATLDNAGGQYLTTTDTQTSSISGTSGTIAVSPGPATHFVVVVPTTAATGTPFNFTVTAEDAYGNAAPSYTGTVGFSSSDTGTGTVLPTPSALTGVFGTFTATLATAGDQIITATDLTDPSITGTSGPVTVSPRVIHFAVTAPSTTTAGTPVTFTVTAENQSDGTVAGYTGTVDFSSTDSGASTVLPIPAPLTLGAGTFTAYLTTAGDQTITVTDATDPSVTASTDVHVSAAGPFDLAVSAPSTVAAGTAFSFTVTAEDAYGNTVTTFTDPLGFDSTDTGTGTVLPTFGLLAAGVGHFTATLATTGPQTITVTDLVNPFISGTSGTISVSPAALSRLAVSVPTTVTAGVPFPFTVMAENQFGDQMSHYGGTVDLRSSDLATPTAVPATVTLTGGSATTYGAFTTAGPQSITATDAATPSVTGAGDATVTPSTAVRFGVSAPTTVAAGTAFSFTVTAEDQFGNATTGYSGTVAFTSSDSGASTVLPASATLTDGTGTFTATLTTGGPQSITATDATDPTITGSATVTVAAPVAGFMVSLPATAVAGEAFYFTVRAVDRFGNTVTDFPGTVALSSTDTGATTYLQPPTTLTGGTGTFLASLTTAGVQTLTVTDATDPTITGSATVTVVPRTAESFVISGPSLVTAGTSFEFTVTAEDAYGNVATNYGGTVDFSSSDSGASTALPAPTTLTDGTGTFTASLTTVGTQSIEATDAVKPWPSGPRGYLVPVTVRPAAAAGFGVSAPATATAGTPFDVTVTAQDRFGNTAYGYAGTVGFTSTDPKAVLPGQHSFVGDPGSHVFTVTLETGGPQTIGVADAAASSISGTSGTVTVSQAPAFTSAAGATFTAGAPGTFHVAATGYPAPTFSESGPLPTGVTLAGTGTLSGTPAGGTGGSYPVTLRAANGVGSPASQAFTLTVSQALGLTTPPTQSSWTDAPVSLALSTTGTVPGVLTFGATNLPAGLSVNPTTGVITGTTGTGPARNLVTATVVSGPVTASTTFLWQVTNPLSGTVPSTQSNWIHSALTVPVHFTDSTGGTLSYTATNLPAGLSVNPTSGVITGTTGNSTTRSFVTVTATDGTRSASVGFLWYVTNPLSATTPPTQDSWTAASVHLPITVTDAVPGAVLSYSAANLPPGLSINPATGVITGTTPSATTRRFVTVTATDGTFSTSVSFTWIVTDPLSAVTPPAQSTWIDTAVTLPVTFTNAFGMLIYSATNLPAGLSINPLTGVITGITTAAGGRNYVTVTAHSGSYAMSVSFLWTVANPLSATSPGAQSSWIHSSVTLPVVVSDASGGSLTYSAANLPTGLSINSHSGVITGTTPASTTRRSVTVTATDGTYSTSVSFLWTVTNPLGSVTPHTRYSWVDTTITPLPVVFTDASGSTLTYSASNLPPGLSVNPTSGVITGTTGGATTKRYVTVTASDGTFSASVSFLWYVTRA